VRVEVEQAAPGKALGNISRTASLVAQLRRARPIPRGLRKVGGIVHPSSTENWLRYIARVKYDGREQMVSLEPQSTIQPKPARQFWLPADESPLGIC
jgi:hypothetical protein